MIVFTHWSDVVYCHVKYWEAALTHPFTGPFEQLLQILVQQRHISACFKGHVKPAGEPRTAQRPDQSGPPRLRSHNTWAGLLLRERGLDEVLLQQLMEHLKLSKALLNDEVSVLNRQPQLIRLTWRTLEMHSWDVWFYQHL